MLCIAFLVKKKKGFQLVLVKRLRENRFIIFFVSNANKNLITDKNRTRASIPQKRKLGKLSKQNE